MSFRVDDKGSHFRPEQHTDGDASKSKDPKADKGQAAKGASGAEGGESVADKKARGEATGDEVVTGGQPGQQPPVPNNLSGQTPQPPDDVKSVDGANKRNDQDVKNALLMYDQMADISFILKDVKETKQEDKLTDAKEMEKELDKATAEKREFNEKFEKVLDLFLQEFGTQKDQNQFCQNQMGPQDQNQELLKLLQTECGLTLDQANDLLNDVHKGDQDALMLALSAAVVITLVEMRDNPGVGGAEEGKDGVPGADGASGDPAAPPPQGAEAGGDGTTTGDVTAPDAGGRTGEVTGDQPLADGGDAATGAATAGDGVGDDDLTAPPATEGADVGTGDGSQAPPSEDVAALAEFGQDLEALFASSSTLSGTNLADSNGAAGFTMEELGELAGKSPDEIRAAVHEKDEEQIKKLREDLKKVLNDILKAAVIVKAMDKTMKTAKKRIQQVFKPQLESQQPSRRIS